MFPIPYRRLLMPLGLLVMVVLLVVAAPVVAIEMLAGPRS